MKKDFAKPRFTGTRFDEHTLPLEVAQDLVAYETLIVELAKHLYLQDNPGRQRVPKGFTSDFRLDIVGIEEGSTKPVLAMVLAGTLGAGSGTLDLPDHGQSYFERARDLVGECVASPENALPKNFPKELLVHFNQLGRSLGEGEALELPTHNGIATLTPTKRKSLVLAADQVYEREVNLAGILAEVDAEKASFRIRTPEGSSVIVPMPEAFLSEARAYLGRSRDRVVVSGVAAYDSAERLQKVISVESFEFLKNYELASSFDDLTQLKDGWFDGQGSALDPEKVAFISEKLVINYPEKLPLPAIVPTQDGDLLLEWDAVGNPSLDINLSDLESSYHAFDHDGGDIERDFRLSDENAWRELFAFLNESIKARLA